MQRDATQHGQQDPTGQPYRLTLACRRFRSHHRTLRAGFRLVHSHHPKSCFFRWRIATSPAGRWPWERSHPSRDCDTIMDRRDHGELTAIQGHARFYEAATAAPLSPWSKTSLQLYMILLVAALNATASGFDGVREKRMLAGPGRPAFSRLLLIYSIVHF